jgi:hypothetical protein
MLHVLVQAWHVKELALHHGGLRGALADVIDLGPGGAGACRQPVAADSVLAPPVACRPGADGWIRQPVEAMPIVGGRGCEEELGT